MSPLPEMSRPAIRLPLWLRPRKWLASLQNEHAAELVAELRSEARTLPFGYTQLANVRQASSPPENTQIRSKHQKNTRAFGAIDPVSCPDSLLSLVPVPPPKMP